MSLLKELHQKGLLRTLDHLRTTCTKVSCTRSSASWRDRPGVALREAALMKS